MAMRIITTALGRRIPSCAIDIEAEDRILKVLLDFRTSPFNPEEVPTELSSLCNCYGLESAGAIAATLVHRDPPLVEECTVDGEPAFRITVAGVIYALSVPERPEED